MYPSPNILRIRLLLSDVRQSTKKCVEEEFFILKSRFLVTILVKKRVIHVYVIYQILDSRDREKTGKIESMTKKGQFTNVV